ncbi:unnamed protein product [Amoebophrya sp. A120]|nr:unnamed protein product [Amoebophrya sp. A120]|eukprot:GSA120T00021226001.1
MNFAGIHFLLLLFKWLWFCFLEASLTLLCITIRDKTLYNNVDVSMYLYYTEETLLVACCFCGGGSTPFAFDTVSPRAGGGSTSEDVVDDVATDVSKRCTAGWFGFVDVNCIFGFGFGRVLCTGPVLLFGCTKPP